MRTEAQRRERLLEIKVSKALALSTDAARMGSAKLHHKAATTWDEAAEQAVKLDMHDQAKEMLRCANLERGYGNMIDAANGHG